MCFTPKNVGKKLISRNFMLVVIAICAHYFANFFAKPKLRLPSQCENFMIFLPFWFYVKSNLGNLEVQKLPFLTFLKLWIFQSIYAIFDSWKLAKHKIQSLSNLKNGTFQTFFSHKIWEVEKFWNFHTVCTLWSWNSRPRNFLALSMQKCECLWISAAITPRTEVSTVFILLSINLITPA